jgi:hypothetical protein
MVGERLTTRSTAVAALRHDLVDRYSLDLPTAKHKYWWEDVSVEIVG